MTTVRQMLQSGLEIAADAREHNTNEVTTGQGPSYGLEWGNILPIEYAVQHEENSTQNGHREEMKVTRGIHSLH